MLRSNQPGRNRIMILFFAAILSGFTFISGFGQEITGKIMDENGAPMPGVNVIETGTTNGTITGIQGEFSINVSDPSASLTFSFIGYESQTVALEGRSELSVQMQVASEVLEDVVVIGYGTVRKEDLTGAVGVVTSEELNRTPIPNVAKALQGRASGVVVMQSGDPGGNYNIRVRGIGSITNDPDPLVVIDGIIGGSLNSVAPEDIESLSVLKDASATAIYGADGANGVIMITTKRGSSEKLDVSLSAYTGVNFRPRKFELMNADQYADFFNSVYEENNVNLQPAYTDEFREWYYGNGWQEGTDWQDEILQNSNTSNIFVRVANGFESGGYSISANVYDETGLLINTNTRRYNFRANSDFKLGDYVKVGESLNLTRSKWRTANGSAWGMALESSPLMKVYNENNKEGFEGAQIGYLWDPDGDGTGDDFDGDGDVDNILNTGGNDKFNPKGIVSIPEDWHYSDNILANVYMEIKPFNWLIFTTTPSIRSYSTRHSEWTPAYDMGVRSEPSANLNEQFNSGSTYAWENKLNFIRDFGQHSFNAVAVYDVRTSDFANSTVNATGFPFEQLNVISQSNPDGRTAIGDNSPNSFSQISYLGRVMYDYASKYYLTTSIRRDGNSRFGSDRRWGNFPSFSLAWKVNEDFLKNVESINMLKLRVGWGLTGNSNIGGFRYQTSLAEPLHFSPVFGVDQTEALALNELWTIGNPIIKWESSSMTNVGLDLNAFRNRLQLSVEYYLKNTDDLLMEVPVSTAHGKWNDVGAYYNIAEVQNQGVEFDVRFSKMEGAFNYQIFANLATVKNEVVYMPSSIINDNNITRIGHTIGSLFGYVAEGIIQESDFDEEGNYLYAEPVTGIPSPGDLRFKDLNQDGRINDQDRTIIGKAVPDLTYSFGGEIFWKNFDFSVFFYGVHDAQILNTQRRDIFSFETQDLDHNKALEWSENYYSPENPTTEYLRLDPNNTNDNTRTSTWWVEDASFLRLKDVQLGYQLPASITNSVGLSKVRFYVSAANIYTFTKYTGYDPESPLNNDEPTLPGVDVNKYPLPRTIIGGLQIDF